MICNTQLRSAERFQLISALAFMFIVIAVIVIFVPNVAEKAQHQQQEFKVGDLVKQVVVDARYSAVDVVIVSKSCTFYYNDAKVCSYGVLAVGPIARTSPIWWLTEDALLNRQ